MNQQLNEYDEFLGKIKKQRICSRKLSVIIAKAKVKKLVVVFEVLPNLFCKSISFIQFFGSIRLFHFL